MIKRLSFVFLVALSISSCVRDFDQLSFQTTATFPIVKGSLSVNDLVGESDSLLQVGSDQSLSIVYRSEIYALESPLDTLVEINIPPFVKDLTLESLELAPQKFEERITFGSLISGTIYAFLLPDQRRIRNPGSGTSFDPDIEDIDIDFSNVLQSAVLTSGDLSIEFENSTPLNITELEFSIQNSGSGDVLYSGSYVINAGETISENIDLAAELNGKPIEGQLSVSFTKVNVAFPPIPPDSIFIDYEDYFSAAVELSDLKVSEASAIFPSQNLVDETDTVGLQGVGNIELTRAIVEKGKIIAEISSTVESEMETEYYVPSAVRNGEIFSFLSVVPAAPPGGTFTYFEEFLYDGYDFDFTGIDGTLTNTFYNTVRARIDSTGEIINLSLDDTLSISIQVDELIPSYVEGYMGQQEIVIPEDTVTIDAFDFLDANGLEFETAKMQLTVENGLGIDGILQFNQLTAMNSETNQSVSFSAIPDLTITEATNLGTSYSPSIQSVDIDNAASILNILPDRIFYDISGDLNPDGNVPAYNDFVYDDAGLSAYIDLEIPFSVKANKVTFEDTLATDLSAITRPEEIKEGVLRFIINNDFPIEAGLSIFLLDENEITLDSLISPNTIAASNNNNGSLDQSVESIIEFAADGQRLDALFNSKRIILKLVLDTTGADFVKLYSTYSFDIQLIAEFKTQIDSDI